MKRLTALLLVLLPIIAKSQNHRWMYVTVTDDHAIMLIDTISAEIRQDAKKTYYPTNTVTFWVMYYQKKTTKSKGSIVTKDLSKVTVDTVKNQFQSASRVIYKNNKVSYSDDSIIDWRDIIPGTVSEELVTFAKSTNNPLVRYSMVFIANGNKKHFPPLSSTE